MSEARRVIGFINAAHFADHMLMLIFPTAVLGMGTAFGGSYGELLSLSLGGFIAFGAGSLPAGWLGDRWSRRNMMAVFFVGIGISAILAGLSPTPALLAAALTLVGLFGSIYHPVGTAMLTGYAERVGREIGINGVWGNLGVAFAALVAGGLTQYAGWRMAFILPGFVAIAAGVAFLAFVPDRPVPKKSTARPAAPMPRAVMLRAFAVMAVVTVAGGVAFNASVIAMPQLFNERLTPLAASPLGIGAAVFAAFALGSVAQIIVGRLIDRHTLKSVFVPLAALQAPCLFLAAVTGGWAIFAVGAAMMFSVFGQVTINDGMVAKYTNDAWRARAYSLRYLMSFGASACAVPMVAYLHDHGGGFDTIFKVLAGFGLVVFLAALFFPHRPEEIQIEPRPLPSEPPLRTSTAAAE